MILALLLIALSFWIFVGNTFLQKIVCSLFSLYFLILLVKKYSANTQIIVLILVLFSVVVFLNKKTINFELNEQSKIKIYPDQVHIKDD